MKKTINNLELTNPILWVTFNQSFEHFIGELEEKYVVYDCFDKCTGFVAANDLEIRKQIQGWEKKVSECSTVIFAASEILRKRLLKFNKNVFTVPNGVDFDLYSKARFNNTKIPLDIENIKKPIIGEVAVFGQNSTDIGILYFIADSHPAWSLVLVGPILSGSILAVNNLKKLKNVYILGMREVSLLPNYLKAIDVFLMTMNLNSEQIKYVTHPNRLFQYMATGKSIVTTRFPGIDKYKDVIKIADNKEDFIPLIEQSLKENSNRLIQKRINLAKQNTWDKRVKSIETVIDKYLSSSV